MKYVLLLLPCALAVAAPLYNIDEPRVAGFPFFYWTLFALVPLSAIFIYVAFRIDRAKGRA